MDSVECRRSLNTTPTSPPAALLTDDEEKEIKVTKISASSSITRRRAQYDYVFQKSASTGNQKASQSTPPARHSTLQQVGLPTLIAVVILICGFIFITRSVWYWADKRSNTNWRQSVRELKRSYPGQDSRLWTVIQSAMQTLLCEGSRFPMAPLVILLLPNSPFAKATDQQSALPAKFADFIQNLSQVLAQLNSAGNQDCVPLNVSDLTSHPHDEKRQPTIKKLLLGKLRSEYDRNFRCFHIPGLDLLSGDVVLGLHGVSDYYSSPFKSSIFLFSLTEPPPCDSPHDFRKVETCVRRHFHSLWDRSIGEEEVAALISRFTGRIAVFV